MKQEGRQKYRKQAGRGEKMKRRGSKVVGRIKQGGASRKSGEKNGAEAWSQQGVSRVETRIGES